MINKKALEEAWINWSWNPNSIDHDFIDIYPFAVTITMKQHCFATDGITMVWLNKEEAERNFRIFMCKLNDHLFGRGWSKKSDGIKVIPFLGGLNESLSLGYRNYNYWNSKEGGKITRTNIHYHAAFGKELGTHLQGTILGTPRTLEDITSMVTTIHNGTPFGKGIREIRVTPSEDTGWLGYGGSQDEQTNGVAHWDNIDMSNWVRS